MKSIKLNNEVEIEIYTSTKELPIKLSKLYTAYALQDAGIGSSIEEVDAHLERLIAFAAEKKIDEIIEETTNLRFNLFSAIEKIDYKSMSFACLIKSYTISGKKTIVQDRSPEGLSALIDLLSDVGELCEAMVEKEHDEVKKKLIPSANSTSRLSLETT